LFYHLTFKVLGIFLAGVELWFFVARPIVREVIVWGAIVRRTPLNRPMLVTFGLALLLLAGLFVPWRGRVDAPGLLRADRQMVLMAAEPGRLVSMVRPGATVAEGDVLFALDSADVSHSIAVSRAQLEAAQAASTTSAFDPDRRRGQQASYARVSEAIAALSRAEAKSANLSVRAPFAGEIRDVPPDLRIGDDIRRLERLGVLVAGGPQLVEAYVAEPDLARIARGAPARIVLLDGRTLPLTVAEIAQASTRGLDVPELASTHDGPIAVRRTGSGPLVPESAIYRVVLTGGEAAAATSRLPGRVVIDAEARSIGGILYRRVVALLLRESSW
jgi:putative peptide zinc metalloprotease protein